MRAEEVAGDPHNAGQVARGQLVRRADAAPIRVDRDADNPAGNCPAEMTVAKVAAEEREAPPAIDRGPSLETRGYGPDVEIRMPDQTPQVTYQAASAVPFSPPPVNPPRWTSAPATVVPLAPAPVAPVAPVVPAARVPIVLESPKMGRHRLRVDLFSVSETLVVIGYDTNADTVIVEPPTGTINDPITVTHNGQAYSCACLGFTADVSIAGRDLLLLVLVRV
jgi:hypothetical protein